MCYRQEKLTDIFLNICFFSVLANSEYFLQIPINRALNII